MGDAEGQASLDNAARGTSDPMSITIVNLHTGKTLTLDHGQSLQIMLSETDTAVLSLLRESDRAESIVLDSPTNCSDGVPHNWIHPEQAPSKYCDRCGYMPDLDG